MAGPGLICSQCYEDSTMDEWLEEADKSDPGKEWVCSRCRQKNGK